MICEVQSSCVVVPGALDHKLKNLHTKRPKRKGATTPTQRNRQGGNRQYRNNKTMVDASRERDIIAIRSCESASEQSAEDSRSISTPANKESTTLLPKRPNVLLPKSWEPGNW